MRGESLQTSTPYENVALMKHLKNLIIICKTFEEQRRESRAIQSPNFKVFSGQSRIRFIDVKLIII